MAVEASIADALQRHLNQFRNSPVLPIAWPGLAFTPPQGPYLAAAYLPNRTDNLFVGNRASARHQGLFQVTIVWPAGQGVMNALQVAERIVDHFAKGTALAVRETRLRIDERPSITPPFQDENRLRIPVTVRWRVFSP